MSAVLELRAVSKVYGAGTAEVHALRTVDLQVDAGELVAVLGPSGCGKSTLLTIAGTLEDPSEGEVLVRASALSGMSRLVLGVLAMTVGLIRSASAGDLRTLTVVGVPAAAAVAGWLLAGREPAVMTRAAFE